MFSAACKYDTNRVTKNDKFVVKCKQKCFIAKKM